MLPPKLTVEQVKHAVAYIEREAEQDAFQLLYDEQPNLFSAVVSVLGTLALHSVSAYEKNPDRNASAGRFPDLILRGAPRKPAPSPSVSLECKASKRPWTVDAHYNHEGWYIIWRYLVDPTRSLGQRVVVWRVESAYLRPSDWKYVGSRAGAHGGGRTHTFTLINPRLILAEPVLKRQDVAIVRGKAVPVGPP